MIFINGNAVGDLDVLMVEVAMHCWTMVMQLESDIISILRKKTEKKMEIQLSETTHGNKKSRI